MGRETESGVSGLMWLRAALKVGVTVSPGAAAI